MSIAGAPGMIRVRASSRKRRRSRLRSTIVCPCFDTITATLACENGEPLARTSRCSVRSRLPVRFTSSRSDSRVILKTREYPFPLRACVLARQPYSQLLPSLLATSAQDLTTPPRRHPLPKPVRPNPTLIPGTVSWLTHKELLQKSDLASDENSPKRSHYREIEQGNSCKLITDRIDFSTTMGYGLPPL